MYDNRIFARNLTRLLDQNGMKKVDLCNICNVSKASITNWCNGLKIPRMDKIEILANYFGVQKSDLLEDKKEDRHFTDLQRQVVDYVVSLPEEKLEALYEFLRKM